MRKLKSAINTYGPFALPFIALGAVFLCPTPVFIERHFFMSGCLTGARDYSDEQQRRCYQHFLQYEALKSRGWKPAGEPA